MSEQCAFCDYEATNEHDLLAHAIKAHPEKLQRPGKAAEPARCNSRSHDGTKCTERVDGHPEVHSDGVVFWTEPDQPGTGKAAEPAGSQSSLASKADEHMSDYEESMVGKDGSPSPQPDLTVTRFRITYDEGGRMGYRVSIPCYDGGEVVDAAAYDRLGERVGELETQLARLRSDVWRVQPSEDGQGGEKWKAFATDLDMQKMQWEGEREELRNALRKYSPISRAAPPDGECTTDEPYLCVLCGAESTESKLVQHADTCPYAICGTGEEGTK